MSSPLPKNNRTWEIQKLQDRHREILRRLAVGESPKQIALDLNITVAMIRYTKNSALGKRELSLMHGARNGSVIEVSEHIKNIAPKALQVLEKVVNGGITSESPDLRQINVSKDILDRAGYGAVRKMVGEFRTRKVSDEKMEEIKQNATNAGIMVEDAEFEEVDEQKK